ncbi:hypothetical protein AB8U03_13435 [Clostridium sp. Mt-5]|uniref:Phage protein n=1 Tax=Clostridium moutaii TaxID=3240932 RepID=A0ABV4BQX1_9CLOT
MLKQQYNTMAELTRIIAESFSLSHVDAEKYAKKLKNMALKEYRKAFRK